ncbi:hypothetical protein A2335_02790 [Candidatus Peregrinibacteria bacterium RIFOXYB2_FULL_32_7]|nr:MAG: hypothetical protein A2335_02790 [Candidatus Peregrinibacteria bacterium RIFOXYB2_FULL_32_7]
MNLQNLINSFISSPSPDSQILQELFQIYKTATKNINYSQKNEAKFTTIDAEACFLDLNRTWILAKSLIVQTHCNGSLSKQPSKLSILEAGSGTGIIAIIAAILNPNLHILGLEINPETYEKSKAFIKYLNLDNQIQILNLDATDPNLAKKIQSSIFNIIFSETLSGGLFFEPQLQIMQNIRKFLKPNGILIPQKISLYLHLEDPFIREPLTENIKYAEINFQTYEKQIISANLQIPIKYSGTPNIIVILSELQLTNEIKTQTDSRYNNFLNRAVIEIPKERQIKLKEADILNLQITYQAGSSTNSCDLQINH